jgi:opacity protein-like surface antigen
MKFIPYVVSFVVAACASASVEAARVNFPTENDLLGIRNTCGGGEARQVKKQVDRILKEIKSDPSARTSTESARRQIAAVMEKIPEGDGGGGFYSEYLACVLRMVDTFVENNNTTKDTKRPPVTVNPGSRVDGFLSLGATYGSIRTGSGDSLTNDNQPIGLVRVGWWFNKYIAFGLEGSYWQRKMDTIEVSNFGELGQPFRTVESTATLPLYLHFGDRFPFTVYVGTGRGWESNEYMALAADGVTRQRHTNRDSGRAWVAGAGFEYAWTPDVSVSILVRGIRTRIQSAPTGFGGENSKPQRDVLSFGVALSFH